MPHHAIRDSIHCSSCDSALRHCRPRPRPLISARTEAERWFVSSPLCLRHGDGRAVVYHGRKMGLEEMWGRKWEEESGGRDRDKDRERRRRGKSEERKKRRRSSREKNKKDEEMKEKKSKSKKIEDSDDSSDSDSSDDEDVEERYCRACELALARCRIWNVPVQAARLNSQKYFASSPVCFVHFRSTDVVKDDKLISLEDLWKEMKAKQACEVCDAAKRSARPLRSPYETAWTEGERYFLPTPFCVLHRKREDILHEDELISVRKYWKKLKKTEGCLSCEGAKKWCRPLQAPNDRAFTEGERWFYPSPLCLMHKDRRKILDGGEMVKMEDYWRTRVEAEMQEKEVKGWKKRQESRRRTSISSDERGRSRDAHRRASRSAQASGLLSPNNAPPHRQHSRGRPRSTADPFRETDESGMRDRRARSFDASRSHEIRRKSRSPSPYPPEWTDDQKDKYAEGFHGLARRHKEEEEEVVNSWNHQFPPPPADQPSHLYPPAFTDQHGRPFRAPPNISHGYEQYGSSVSASIISPRSGMNGPHQDGNFEGESSSDDSDDSLSEQHDRKQDDLSLIERLGISSPSSNHT